MRRRSWQAAVLAAVASASAVAGTPATVDGQTYNAILPFGSAQSSPDAAVGRPVFGGPRIDVVVRGTDNGIWHSTRPAGGGPWSAWDPLGAPPGGVKGDPALVSWGDNRLDLFVRGADDKLWQRFSSTPGAWSPWIKPVGDDGVLASAPEASTRGVGRLDVFVLGTDGQLYQRFFENSVWNPLWLGHGDPEGPTGLVGEPAPVSWDSVRVDVFARGTDDKLWQKTWNGQAWSAWMRPVGNEGTLASSPEAISTAVGQIFVYARGTDNLLYILDFRRSAWDRWIDLAHTMTEVFRDSPTAVPRGEDLASAFVRGTDNLVYEVAF